MNSLVTFLKSVTDVKPNAQLDADVLGITYYTTRVVGMGYPYSEQELAADPSLQYNGAPIQHVASYLQSVHAGRYMVWNLSEKVYDYSKLENQVLEFRFPGYPAAPLPTMFAICNSINGWLQADEQNVAIIHCQTGKGRTLCTIAWYLTWSGLLPSLEKTLQHLSNKIGSNIDKQLIPTQKRYLSYLTQMLNGHKPSTIPILLDRIIMNTVPQFEDDRCRPYLQIFKGTKLIFTSTGRDSTQLRWYNAADNSILFPVNLALDGDVLIRIRHLATDSKRISMMRFGLHSGFLTEGNVRFMKSELDGCCGDERFGNDFWLDLIVRNNETGENKEETAEGESYWDREMAARKEIVVPTAKPIDKAGNNAQPAAVAAAPVSSTSSTTSTSMSSDAAAAAAKKALSSASTAASNAVASAATALKSFKFSLFGDNDNNNDQSIDEKDADSSITPAPAKSKKSDQSTPQSSPSTTSAPSTPTAHPNAPNAAVTATPNTESFEELQRYVRGLGALNDSQTDIHSDDEASLFEELEKEIGQELENKTEIETTATSRPVTEKSTDSTTPTTTSTTTPVPSTSSVSVVPTSPSAPDLDISLASITSPASHKLSTSMLEAELAAISADDSTIELTMDDEDMLSALDAELAGMEASDVPEEDSSALEKELQNLELP